ncbi:MAG: LCP family protein [Lachnospiraceae bacterium]|nr:LCP family protein [Lachnospiraceae bacterium]
MTKRNKKKKPVLQADNELKKLQDGLIQELSEYQNEKNEKFHGIDAREDEDSKRKKIHPLKILVGILIGILILLTIAIATFFVMRFMGKSSLLSKPQSGVAFSAPEKLKKEVAVDETGGVVYKGQKYQYNENIINILCMGIDKEIFNEADSIAAGDSGQADTLFLITMDTTTGKTKLLSISRDSMVDVNVYTPKGEYVKTDNMQICLAYATGDGKALSCENTARSVSRLLYGVPVNAYAAIDLTAIGILNDAIGGVEVEVIEDLSQTDPGLKLGERVKLLGQQAETYVRTRDRSHTTGDEAAESNSKRMERQKQYITSFIGKTISQTKQDITVPITLFNVASNYMVTDVTAPKVAYLASLIVEHGFSETDILSVPGKASMGERYAEYRVDQKALYELILETFYVKEE